MTAGDVSRVAGLFDAVSETYDQVGVDFFGPVAGGLVNAMDLRPGESLLDIGCGRGRVLLAAAPELGSDARLLGLDVSAGMISQAREVLDSAGLDWVRVAVADAASLDPAIGTFDVVTASLVLFFLPDPGVALRSWYRVVIPGGRIGVTTFGSRDPRWERLDAVFTPHLPADLKDARTTGARGPFASDEGVEGLLLAAGFADALTSHLDLSVSFDDVEHWHRWTLSTGQSAMWAAVPVAERAEVLADAREVLANCVGPDGRIHLGQRVRITTAKRP